MVGRWAGQWWVVAARVGWVACFEAGRDHLRNTASGKHPSRFVKGDESGLGNHRKRLHCYKRKNRRLPKGHRGRGKSGGGMLCGEFRRSGEVPLQHDIKAASHRILP